jgi:hypothetical protein
MIALTLTRILASVTAFQNQLLRCMEDKQAMHSVTGLYKGTLDK